jgi:hypothetical protein
MVDADRLAADHRPRANIKYDLCPGSMVLCDSRGVQNPSNEDACATAELRKTPPYLPICGESRDSTFAHQFLACAPREHPLTT